MKEFDLKVFADRLKELRLDKSWTHFQLAVKAGCQPGAISKWEKGERIPMGDNLFKLAQTFSCTTDYLLGLED